MRLIDANKIIYMWQEFENGEFSDGVTLQSIIARMPTVEAVPVVQGEWIFGKDHGEFVEAECSACNGLLLVKWYDKLSEYNYCPKCGADMRKKV